MIDSPNRQDIDLLRSIAALRAVTVNQLALLSGRTQNALRPRVRFLEGLGLVQSGTFVLGRGRGRPEKVLGISTQGLKALREAGFESAAASVERPTNPRLIAHQLLISAFRVQVSVMTRTWPEFQAKFLVPSAPEPADGADGERARQVPDAVLGLTHAGMAKTLLFFLEADRGTETLSGRGSGGDIRQKIIGYQSRFRSGEYKRYEKIFGGELKGFRVLFVTDTETRLAALCRIVQDTPPSDFIWLTDEASLSSPGIGAPIWYRGGRMDLPRQSILGSKIPASLQPPPSSSL